MCRFAIKRVWLLFCVASEYYNRKLHFITSKLFSSLNSYKTLWLVAELPNKDKEKHRLSFDSCHISISTVTCCQVLDWCVRYTCSLMPSSTQPPHFNWVQFLCVSQMRLSLYRLPTLRWNTRGILLRIAHLLVAFMFEKVDNYHLPINIWGLACQKQVSRTGPSNYIPHNLLHVTNCPCPIYLLLEHKPIYVSATFMTGFHLVFLVG